MQSDRLAVILVALAACAGGRARDPGPAPVAAALAASSRMRLAADWGAAARRVQGALASSRLTREETVRLLVEKASIEREVGWFRRRAATADSLRTVARARALVDDRMSPGTRAAVIEADGWLIYWRGFEEKESFDRALPLFEAARRLREAAGDRAGLAASWFEIGLVHQQTGRLDKSRTALARGQAIAVSDRLLVELAYLERHMGANAEAKGDLAAALTYYGRSLKLREQSGHRWGEVFAAVTFADLLARQGQPARAGAILADAAALAVRLDLPVGEASAAESQAGLAHAASRAPEACGYLERAARAWTRYGDPAALAAVRARAAEWSCPVPAPG